MGLHKPKQVRIEAMQNDGTPEQIKKIIDWVNSDDGSAFQNEPGMWPEHILLSLRGGRLILSASPGDWIVRADDGVFFVMIDEHFKLMFT